MDISRIVLDVRTQLRTKVSDERVKEYAEAMSEGAHFPPVVVFGTDDQAILSDGWHRIEAALLIGLTEIEADVRPGNLDDAIWYALWANAHHGLSYSTAEKRANIEKALLLRPYESDRVIAKQCGVSHPTVADQRRKLESIGKIYHSEARTASDGKERAATQPPRPRPEQPPVDDYDDGGDALLQSTQMLSDDPEPEPPTGAAPTLGQMLASGQLTLEPMPEQSAESKAYYRFVSIFTMVSYDPREVARAATQPASDEPGWIQYIAWFEEFWDEYRKRLKKPMRIVGGR
jgi:hypothetical protein